MCQRVYLTAKEAERELGINHSGISKACRGIQKTAGGYHWCHKTGGDAIASD